MTNEMREIREAISYMEEAKRNLTVFQKELRDVNGTYNLRLVLYYLESYRERRNWYGTKVSL